VGAVNEPVRGGAGIGWVVYEGVPIVARDLVGEDSRAAPVAFPEDFLGGHDGRRRQAVQAQSSRMKSWTPVRLRNIRA
jgi:hypothetical protein